MDIEILFFGQLTDKTGSHSIQMSNPGNIMQLKDKLFEQFPSLELSKFVIALNNKMVLDNANIPDSAVIALMPPFSGG